MEMAKDKRTVGINVGGYHITIRRRGENDFRWHTIRTGKNVGEGAASTYSDARWAALQSCIDDASQAIAAMKQQQNEE